MKRFEAVLSRQSRFAWLVCLLFMLGLTLRLWGLISQPLTADDRLVAVSAANFVDGGQLGPIMWNHPVLRNLLVYLSLDAWGPNALSLKASSLLLGAVSVPLLVVVAARLLASPAAGLIAGFLLAIDSFHIGFSRQAVHEVYMAFFALCGIWCALQYQDKAQRPWLLVAGLCFGLGVASKWDVLFPLAVTLGYLLLLIRRESEQPPSVGVAKALFVGSSLIFLPLAVYLLSFLPWFQRGYSISEWLGLQWSMATEVTHHLGTHNPYLAELDHQAALWFVKPVAYASFALEAGRPVVLVEISSPLVWLLVLPAVAFIAYRGIMRRRAELIYLALLFVATYLPFALTSRPIWAHSALSVLPYGFAAIGGALAGGWLGVRDRWIYLTLVAALAIPLYFLATGAGYDSALLRPIVEFYRPSFDH